FTHGRHALDDPHRLAGTAVPDWLSVVDRRVRVRSKRAAAFVNDVDPLTSSLARGIVDHHRDDGWFHATPAFAVLSAELATAARNVLPPDTGLRTWFLGHVLVELLLDAELIRREPQRLTTYYDQMASIDAPRVARLVGQMSGRDEAPPQLEKFIAIFLRERFLADYVDDQRLMFRLGQVLRRVRLPSLPAEFAAMLPGARRKIAERADELLQTGS
ncbi:MAG: hypothetical protein K8T25_12265, partial [Planctomycetia bacterium]|nr:hypothetical protein [Planctomycetia bacterium]